MKKRGYLLFYAPLLALYTNNIKSADQLRGGAFTYDPKTNEYIPIHNKRGEKTKYSKFIHKDSSALIIKYKNNPAPSISPEEIYALLEKRRASKYNRSYREPIILPIQRQFASLGIEQKFWQYMMHIVRKSLCEKYNIAAEESIFINEVINTTYVDWPIIKRAYSALRNIEWLQGSTALKKPYTITSFPHYLKPVVELTETELNPMYMPESWFLHAIDSEIEERSLAYTQIPLQREDATYHMVQPYQQEEVPESIRDAEIDWFTSLFN